MTDHVDHPEVLLSWINVEIRLGNLPQTDGKLVAGPAKVLPLVYWITIGT